MQRKRLVVMLLLIALVASLLTVVAFAAGEEAAASTATCTYCSGNGCDECGSTGVVTSTSYMAFSFWALIPPIVAIALALITKEVYSSLFIGILLGCFFYANGNPIIALDALTNHALIAALADNAGIFIFLVVLGIMVSLINKSGGSAAFGRWAEKNI
ncbi:MAG: Na+/H+ antiporter NhaC family protein, partial [Oscillospiraceae bacterium]|nr:Na+/H+ antiporter NhaC family protein [Oscillospiraceae bacterium]